MIDIVIGKVGFFIYKGKVAGSTDASITICLLGFIGIIFWSGKTMGMYHRCLRTAISDVKMIDNARSIIQEKVDQEIKQERVRYQECLNQSFRERDELNEKLMVERSKVSTLETTLKEMFRLFNPEHYPICEICGEPVTEDQKNVGIECDLHEECAKG